MIGLSRSKSSKEPNNNYAILLIYERSVKGGAVAQSVERAIPGQEVPGSIPAVAARSLLVGSVSV